MRHHENVGKQYCRVQIITPEWLHRHFRRKFRVVAEIKERPRLLPDGTILGKITPCLAHEPNGPAFCRLAHQDIQQSAAGGLNVLPHIYHSDSSCIFCLDRGKRDTTQSNDRPQVKSFLDANSCSSGR